MAGGTFKLYNKVRPGAYINVEGWEKVDSTISERGIVALPLKLDFGAQVNCVDAQSDFKKLFGYSFYDANLLLIRDALKGAKKVIVYRLNCAGEKAKIAEEAITVTAKYAGTLGNKLKVVITEKMNQSYFVETYLGQEVVDVQEVVTKEEVKDNDFVTFEIVTLEANAGLVLAGGTDSVVNNGNYTDFLNYMETQKYNTLAFPMTEEECSTLVPVIKAFLIRQREELGVRVQAVVPASTVTCDYEGIIQVINGVELVDGTIVDKSKITAFVAGLTAGADVATSNTYVTYEGATRAYPEKTNEEIIKAIQEGCLVFNEECKIETDINSLVTFANGKISAMAKNRTIRVLDTICNDIKDIFSKKYIGKVNSDADGRNMLKADMISYMTNLQNRGAIEEFDATQDIEVTAGDSKDIVIVDIAVKSIDAMEKLYMTINLR